MLPNGLVTESVVVGAAHVTVLPLTIGAVAAVATGFTAANHPAPSVKSPSSENLKVREPSAAVDVIPAAPPGKAVPEKGLPATCGAATEFPLYTYSKSAPDSVAKEENTTFVAKPAGGV